ncbi:hypothetical protein Y032_0132g1679 [Ancylostoma ceylanicum]|uniref:TAR DNA-binding protein 43 N-terminal domain-containing protein n=1 Tax=Ancylostoma ceylanicum TaxID=53326 RepID=A0A016T5L0_9BILA|nr:hypothetical protein Y032_0132g1679 [Ancylostoma ceylanicum]
MRFRSVRRTTIDHSLNAACGCGRGFLTKTKVFHLHENWSPCPIFWFERLQALSPWTWVRLQIEPVEVATDENGIVFSSVQSVVPGAHGLYYRQDGQRRPLDYDTNTGRILAPANGWNAQDIFIHLAHGSKHGSHYADYSKASQQFEKNVSAVQKLIAAAGLTYGFKAPRAEKTTRTSSRTRGVKSGFEAQPENVHISDESDNNTVNQLVEQKNREIEKLLDANEELKLRVKELKAELREEMRNNIELQRSLGKSEEKETDQPVQSSTGPGDENLDFQEQRDALEKAKLVIIEKDEELKKKTDEIAQLRARLGDVEQTVFVPSGDSDERIASLESKIAELVDEKAQVVEAIQAEQLAVVNEKDQHISQLVSELETANNDLRDARNRIQELGEKEEEINNLHNVIADLRANLATAKKEKEESEWHLGEHKEWLSNSKEKVAYLENQLSLLSSDPDRLAPPPPSSPKMRSGLENADESAKAQIRSLETKLQLANQSFRNSEAERQKCEQISRDTLKRIVQLENENGRLQGINEELTTKLRESASVQVLEEKDARLRDLADERSRLQWRIGELSQWWSDAKWKAVDRCCGDQGFGTRSVPGFCKYYSALPCDRCTCLTNIHIKSSPDGSVVRAADSVRRNLPLSLVPLRWRSKVKRRFCSAVSAMQCSGFTASNVPLDLLRVVQEGFRQFLHKFMQQKDFNEMAAKWVKLQSLSFMLRFSNKIGELEAGVAHQRHLLDTANTKIQSLNEQAPQTSTTYMLPSYSVSQAYPGQWHLANNCFAPPTISAPTPFYTSPLTPYETKRVKLEIDIGPSQDVFVMGSFLNWQCALKCDPIGEGRKGVTVDLPRGRQVSRSFHGNLIKDVKLQYFKE